MSAIEIGGRLEGFQLGDLMKMIRASRRTGTLVLNDHGRNGTIEFLDGRIVRARASWDYDSLGALLVERGAITEEQLLKAVETKRSKNLAAPIGRVLIDLGMTTVETVRESMRLQVDDVVGQLMLIDRGNFEFQPASGSADEITQDIGDVLRELSVTVESAAARPAVAADRPAADPRMRALKRQLLALREAGTKPAIAQALVRLIARHVERLVVFERRQNALRATTAHGVEARDLALERTAAGPLWDCAEGASYADVSDPGLQPLYGRIGAPAGRSCLLVGLAGLGRPLRAVYADQGARRADLPCLDHVDLLRLEAELLTKSATGRASGRTRRKSN